MSLFFYWTLACLGRHYDSYLVKCITYALTSAILGDAQKEAEVLKVTYMSYFDVRYIRLSLKERQAWQAEAWWYTRNMFPPRCATWSAVVYNVTAAAGTPHIVMRFDFCHRPWTLRGNLARARALRSSLRAVLAPDQVREGIYICSFWT